MKRTQGIILSLLLSILIALLFIHIIPDANAAYETFLAYTEIDPNSHITITNNTHVSASMYSNEDAYLYGTSASNRFSVDFSHRLDLYIDEASEGEKPSVWALTESLDDRKGLEDANKNFLSVNINGSETIFGNQYGGTTNHLFAGADDIIATHYTTPDVGLLKPITISAHLYVSSGSCQIAMSLYRNDTYEFVCATDPITIDTTLQYWPATVNSSVYLEGDTTYLVTLKHNRVASELRYRQNATAGTVNTWKQTLAYGSNWPDPFNPSDTYEERFAIYVIFDSSPFIEIEESSAGSIYKSSYNLTTDVWHYLLIKREEATMNFTLGVYSSEALRNTGGVADVLTLNLTLHTILSYDYILVCQTWNSGSGYCDIQIKNLDLQADYEYLFYGLYNEQTGDRDGAVNVTAHFEEGTYPVTFSVDGEHLFAVYQKPIYFAFNLTNTREYWLGSTENTATIYIFDDSTTTYTIAFYDFAGILNEFSYVEAKRYVNATLRTVEKRTVDVENKLIMQLINGDIYTLLIGDGAIYTYGDLRVTSDTSITLTLKSVSFPKETLLTYQYVRIYGLRAFDNPTGNITITYEDTLNQTNSVNIYINHKNGTNIYNANVTSSSFVHVWANALNNTDYRVTCYINHQRYGVYPWRQYFPRTFSEMPFGLGFLGTLPFDTAYILPAALILFAGGSFSVLNVPLGAFITVITAAILSYIGFIPIPAATLITGFMIVVLLGIIYVKRRILQA